MVTSVDRYVFFNTSFTRRLRKDSCKGHLFFLPVFLAFISSIFIFFYASSVSRLNIQTDQTTLQANIPLLEFTKFSPNSVTKTSIQEHMISNPSVVISQEPMIKVQEHPILHEINSGDVNNLQEPMIKVQEHPILHEVNSGDVNNLQEPAVKVSETSLSSSVSSGEQKNQWPTEIEKVDSTGNIEKKDDVFHDRNLFKEEYEEMNRSLKIYAYPHKKNDPFANILLPVHDEPGGNYASESYFKKALFKSHFFTNDPSEADLFYLPFSIASLRHDKRIGVGGIQNFIRKYIQNISRSYPYWNRTGGADHFYVACHSVGRSAMEKAVEVKLNAIQVVCSSSYFLPGYLPHKDASIPQIWPRKGKPPTRLPSERKNLAFYAGAMNSHVREVLVKLWKNDTEISVHQSRLKTPYSEALLGSKYCIHAKGFEVNTARIGDALYYGCVPVILADHYDLPYADILNWNSFSVIVSTMDIPFLKKILQKISFDEYLKLQSNVMKVQKHFQWHHLPVDLDVFYMIMYELWLRRSHLRISIFDFV